jgi:hypothetical protein
LDIRSDSTWSNSAIITPTTTNQNPVLAFYRPTGSAATSYPWWLEANGSTFQIKTGSAANIGSETVSTKVTINSSGNVGIGTTSPAAKLEVEGGDPLLQLSTSSGTGNPYLSFNQAGSRRSFIQYENSGSALKLASEYGGIDFYTGTSGTETEKMTIQSDGDVGIGTTSPQAKLHVANGSLRTWTPTAGTTAIFESTQNSRSFITITGANETELWFGEE